MTDYESMSDFEINKAVTCIENNCSGWEFSDSSRCFHAKDENGYRVVTVKDYCNNIANSWPIIVDNEIAISPDQEVSMEVGIARSTGIWTASGSRVIDGEICLSSDCFIYSCENPLRAAMIVFLMMQEAEQ